LLVQDDLDLVKEAGKGNINVTVGSALDIFGGDMSYFEVLHWHRRQQAGR
jgi:phosphoribosylformimino-5-aminoimidazole carboxamide ribotide isomerase